jgi:hypothetical protein
MLARIGTRGRKKGCVIGSLSRFAFAIQGNWCYSASRRSEHLERAGKVMPTNLFDLSGHAAVVTGGNGGIGRGIA